MILAGDEFGRTQQGNNNAYCQDNEISWVDWGNLNTAGGTLFEFTKRLISLIKQYPILRRSRFISGQRDDGRAPISGVRRKGSDVTLLLIASAHNEMIKFKLPLGTGGHGWKRLLDTSSYGSTVESAGAALSCGAITEVGPHSISLFKLWNNSRS
jgi:isoamylase